jgi:enamine deaminase RidA (YjgF/YER057c/UK114 family)
VEVDLMNEVSRYLGDINYGGQKMGWGKGNVSGNIVFLSGAEGQDPKTGQFPKDIETQTTIALQKIKERLAEAGTDFDHIVRYDCYIVGRENIQGYFKAKNEFFKQNYTLPSLIYASTHTLAAGLMNPEMLVEIEVTAVLK